MLDAVDNRGNYQREAGYGMSDSHPHAWEWFQQNSASKYYDQRDQQNVVYDFDFCSFVHDSNILSVSCV